MLLMATRQLVGANADAVNRAYRFRRPSSSETVTRLGWRCPDSLLTFSSFHALERPWSGGVPNARLSLDQIFNAVASLGMLGFALLALYAFLTERVVPRSRLDELRADRKEAMDLARQSVAAQERLSDAVEAKNRLDEAKERAEIESARRRR